MRTAAQLGGFVALATLFALVCPVASRALDLKPSDALPSPQKRQPDLDSRQIPGCTPGFSPCDSAYVFDYPCYPTDSHCCFDLLPSEEYICPAGAPCCYGLCCDPGYT